MYKKITYSETCDNIEKEMINEASDVSMKGHKENSLLSRERDRIL